MSINRKTQSERSAQNLWVSALLGWILAFAGATIIFAIASLLGVSLLVSAGPDPSALAPLTLTGIALTTLIAAIAATGLYALLQRIFKERATRIFQIIAIVFLFLSFAGPLSLSVSPLNTLILVLMHILTAGAILWALTLR